MDIKSASLRGIGISGRLSRLHFRHRCIGQGRMKTRVCCISKPSKPPSMLPSATELESLGKLSTIIPDTLIMEETSILGKPMAATVSAGILLQILSSTTGYSLYKNAIEKGLSYDRDPEVQLNKVLANVGAIFANQVEGRVANKLDCRNAYNTDGLVAQARNLLKIYNSMDIPSDKVIMQIPATWEGIQASKVLEQDRINTLIDYVFSFCQALAAVQVGASVLQINISRISDWYKSHPNAIRDPKGPREDTGFSSLQHPGIELVRRVYTYCARHKQKSKIMVSGLRTREDALAVAGVDFIILGPKILRILEDTPTAEGYNYDVSGSMSNMPLGVVSNIYSEEAEHEFINPCDIFTREKFDESIGQVAASLLKIHVEKAVKAVETLIPSFEKRAIGMD